MYAFDGDVAKDREKALAPLEVACGARIEDACSLLGATLFVVGEEGARAKQLLERDCATDSSYACHALAVGYKLGAPGWPADPDLAKKLFEKACKLGDPQACNETGATPGPVRPRM
jgi:TPR repeat protein